MSSLLGSSGAVAAAAVGAAPAGGAGDVGVPAGWQPGAAQAGGDGRAVLRLSGGEGGGHPRGAGGAPGVGPGGGEPVAGGGAGGVRGDGGERAHGRIPASRSSSAMRRSRSASRSRISACDIWGALFMNRITSKVAGITGQISASPSAPVMTGTRSIAFH